MPWPKGQKRPGYQPKAGIQRRCEDGCTCDRHHVGDEHRARIATALTGRKLSEEHREAVRRGATTHGQSGRGRNEESRTYNTWRSMRMRCFNPNSVRYQYYGGRGVTVCERWESFENFLADMGERPEGRTLDRIDPYGNYEPTNCRWATPAEQANNRRTRQRVSVE